MALWQNLVEVSDIPSLKNLIPVDGDKRLVKTVSSIIPTSGAWYRYESSASYSELLPAIVSPDSGTGRWIMLNPVVYSFNAPLITPPFADIVWIQIDSINQWISKIIDNDLQWISSNNPVADRLFTVTSAIATTNDSVAQGANSVEFLCLSGTATVGNIPLVANATGINGIRLQSLAQNETYNNIPYTVSGQLLITESRLTSSPNEPINVTLSTFNLTNTSGNTPNNCKWISAFILSGAGAFADIPLDDTNIKGYELNYQSGKLYGAIAYSVEFDSELILVVAV
jgi:hypothetical protein